MLDVLYEDNHLLAVNKPAGLATMGALSGRDSLVEQVRRYLKDRYQKPGNVYVGVVSRLDAAVTGVVLLARTSKAAQRLTRQFAHGEPHKIYWAVIDPPLSDSSGQCVDWLWHDDLHQRVVVRPPETPEAKQARLTYRTLKKVHGGTLLEIKLETGRKHQIRVQLSHRGSPILGDTKYGSTTAFSPGIALHARRLEIVHPVRHVPLFLDAPLPSSWKSLGVSE
jgi:23S rRNA pseudouridine1911/1915/1917 synthase